MRRNLLIFLIIVLYSVNSLKFLDDLKDDILPEDMQKVFKLISDSVKENKDLKGKSFEKTAYISDTYGPRLWGHKPLELALNHIKRIMEKDGFENVRLEEIKDVPVWTRGKEYLVLKSPRKVPFKIPMIGLGLSVGGDLKDTEVIVVQDFEELDKLEESKVKDKIVLMNGKWDKNYGNTVKYRFSTAMKAAEKGAKGAIIRSIAPKSLETPHTGSMGYKDGVEKIPVCAISLEDADMFDRMYKRGQKITVDLYMEAKFEETKTTSHNIIGEIIGSEKPEEIVLLGGHLDSWDTGPQTGANDDLSGFFVCYEAARVIKFLNLKPKRTIRVIGWSGEEMGFPNSGAKEYAKNYEDKLINHSVAFESDEGVTRLRGFGFKGSKKGFSILTNELSWLMNNDYNYNKFYDDLGVATDISPLISKGVPGMINIVDNDPLNDSYDVDYFNYHHSAADTVSILDPTDMDSNVIGIAQVFYYITNLPSKLPRN